MMFMFDIEICVTGETRYSRFPFSTRKNVIARRQKFAVGSDRTLQSDAVFICSEVEIKRTRLATHRSNREAACAVLLAARPVRRLFVRVFPPF